MLTTCISIICLQPLIFFKGSVTNSKKKKGKSVERVKYHVKSTSLSDKCKAIKKKQKFQDTNLKDVKLNSHQSTTSKEASSSNRSKKAHKREAIQDFQGETESKRIKAQEGTKTEDKRNKTNINSLNVETTNSKNPSDKKNITVSSKMKIKSKKKSKKVMTPETDTKLDELPKESETCDQEKINKKSKKNKYKHLAGKPKLIGGHHAHEDSPRVHNESTSNLKDSVSKIDINFKKGKLKDIPASRSENKIDEIGKDSTSEDEVVDVDEKNMKAVVKSPQTLREKMQDRFVLDYNEQKYSIFHVKKVINKDSMLTLWYLIL